MSRGGRGRGGSAARVNGQPLPFEVDAALESEVAASRARDREDDGDDWKRTLYPPYKVPVAPPLTKEELEWVDIWRKNRATCRNGPYFMDESKTEKRDAAHFNAFEDNASYGNKRVKRSNALPNLKKVPFVKRFYPRELWDVISDGEDDRAAPSKPSKKVDKLAQFGDHDDADAALESNDEDNDAHADETKDEDAVEEPQDDDFSEDEDDLANDYNAEKYFDDGDGGDEDYGGEDGGGGGGGGEDGW